MDVYADFLELLKQEPLDFRMVDMQASLMLNLLPDEAGDKVQKESNRAMAETLRKALEPFMLEPVSFFKHEAKPCGCPVCQGRKVHLAN